MEKSNHTPQMNAEGEDWDYWDDWDDWDDDASESQKWDEPPTHISETDNLKLQLARAKYNQSALELQIKQQITDQLFKDFQQLVSYTFAQYKMEDTDSVNEDGTIVRKQT